MHSEAMDNLKTIRVLYMLAVRHHWEVGKIITHKGKKYIIRDLYDHTDNTRFARKWAIAKIEPVINGLSNG